MGAWSRTSRRFRREGAPAPWIFFAIALVALAPHPFSFWKTGTPTQTPTPTPAPNDYSLLLNGSSQYFTVTSTPLNPNADFTFEAWVKLSREWTNNIVFTYRNGTSAPYWSIVIRNDGSGFCVQYDTGGGQLFIGASGASIFIADGWTHMAVTRSGNSYTFYKNGAVLKTATNSITTFTTSTPTFGALPNGNWFTGRIDEVRTWNVARTQAQINGNKSAVLTGAETGLIRYYRFEEGSGSTVIDTTGNDDGTLVGSPTWSTDKPF